MLLHDVYTKKIGFYLHFSDHVENLLARLKEYQDTNVMMFTRLMQKLNSDSEAKATSSNNNLGLAIARTFLDKIPFRTLADLTALNDRLVSDQNLKKILVRSICRC